MEKIPLWPLALLLLVAACTQKKEAEETKPVTPVTRVVGIGKVTPRGGVSELAAPASGIVTEVRFSPGDSVKAGDVLLLVDETDEALLVKEADSRIASQRHVVEAARSSLEQEKLASTEKLRLLTDARELLEVGASTGEEVRTLQNEYDLSMERQKKLESDLEMQHALLQEAAVQRASRLTALEKRQFRSPVDGILLDIHPRVGEAVNLHGTYARVSPEGELIVVAEIDELFADRLAVGQRCSILIADSLFSTDEVVLRVSPDLKRKSLFSDSGNDLEDRRVREIEVSLRNAGTIPLIDTKVECMVTFN